MQAPAVDTYIDDHTYAALREELAELVATPFVFDQHSEIVRILGEIGGIWPRSVMDDAETA